MAGEIDKCIPLILNHFQLPEEELSLARPVQDDLERKLASIINVLLNQDMGRLMSALYKIDVGEQVFKEIIAQADLDEIGLQLAREVIKRELKKVETREKYRGLF